MKKLNFKIYVLTLAAVFFAPSYSIAQQAGVLIEPPCTTTTCIGTDMIAVAKHELVIFDAMPSHILGLSFAEPCAAPSPTGVTVMKQIPGDIEQFPDTLCTNQGCFPDGAGGGETCVE